MNHIIKFNLDFNPSFAIKNDLIIKINAWRDILYLCKLVGYSSQYGGGYGNLSQRIPNKPERFVITGSQTGDLKKLTKKHYSIVLQSDFENNKVAAKGYVKPSSESMTHAIIYSLYNNVNAVIHVHSPCIFEKAFDLKIPITDKVGKYGSVELVNQIKLLSDQGKLKKNIFAIGSHKDGIIAFGKTSEKAGLVVIKYLSKALALQK